MSNREQRMVFVMLILLVIAGGFKFIVQPQIDRNTTLSNNLIQLQLTTQLTQAEIDSYAIMETNYQAAQDALDALDPTLDDYRQDEEIDRMLYALAQSAQLEIQELKLASYSPTPELQSQSDATATLTSPQLTAKEFELTVQGDSANFISLISNLQAMKDVLISDLYQRIENEETVVTITGLVYMDVEKS